MNPHYELISHALCPYVQRSVIVLTEKGIPYRRTDIDLANKPEWFQDLSPTGKVPVLVVGGHGVLFESAIICEYLDESTPGTLHPESPWQRARHRAWIEFGSNLLNHIAQLYNAPDKAAFDTACAALQERLERLEAQLDAGPYFAGRSFHLVDAVYGPVFRYFDVFETSLDLRVVRHTQRIRDWRGALRERPSIAAAVPTDYTNRLVSFLVNRKSYLASLVAQATGEAPAPY